MTTCGRERIVLILEVLVNALYIGKRQSYMQYIVLVTTAISRGGGVGHE